VFLNPSSQPRITPFEALAQGLADAGVDRVFGLMGDDSVRLVAALIARGMPYSDTRHENAAVAMAVGYASAADRLGVCIISRGPGTTNGLTGAVNASRGDAPVLIITGDQALAVPANTAQLPDHKALDATTIASACGIAIYTPRTPESISETLRDAIDHALTGRTVLLTLPRDLLETPVARPAALEITAPARIAAPAPAPAIAAALSVLEKSRRPLILAGAGAWSAGARDALSELADRIGGALATTLRGKDMFAGNPYDLGIVGSFSHSAGRRLIDEADAVLVFGASLNRWTTNGGTSLPEVPIIHVDADRSHVTRYHRADVAICGDARAVAEQLLEALPERAPSEKPWHTAETRERLAAFDLAEDFTSAATRWAMDPRSVVMELDRLLPADRAVVTDNGNFFGFVPTHISVPTPDRFKLSSDFSVIGLGFGTALGATVARPDVSTVLFIGDGALLMTLGEIETLARMDVPLTVIVMNDSSYGAEQHFLELRGFSGTMAQFPDADFAEVAAAFGVESATVRTIDELRALGPRLASREGPLLIDCKVVSTVIAPFLSE
jgi:acetolactate synthase-1/2/3 large subunit